MAGKTKQTLSEYQTSGNYSYNGTIVPGNGVNVILSVRYSDTGYTDRNYLYAATTDANGVYKFVKAEHAVAPYILVANFSILVFIYILFYKGANLQKKHG